MSRILGDNGRSPGGARPGSLDLRCPSGRWTNPQLTRAHLYYPLGPSYIRLDAKNLDRVLEALPRTMWELSLEAVYQDSPISVECRSLEGVKLEVIILASQRSEEEITVEVARTSGDAIAFRRYGNRIFRAVMGYTPSKTSSQAHFGCGWPAGTRRRGLGSPAARPVTESAIAQALEAVADMLAAERNDASRLAYESLTYMCDAQSSGRSVSAAASLGILIPRTGAEKRISDSVFEKACQSMTVEATAGEICYLAQIVVARAIWSLADSEMAAVREFMDVCPHDLIASVVGNIRGARNSPHRAYFAVVTFTALCRCVPSVRTRIDLDEIRAAQSVGKSCHRALENASNELIRTLSV